MQSSIFNFFSNHSSNSEKKYFKSLKRKSRCNEEIVIISSDEDDRLGRKSIKRSLSSKNQDDTAIYSNVKNDDDLTLNCHDKQQNVETVEGGSHYSVKDEPYYLKNFKLAIDSVLNDEDEAKLFEGEDADWLEKFYKLPVASQMLYVRLFHRKTAWLPFNKITYPEIGDDLSQPLQLLVREKFLQCSISEGKPNLSLDEVLHLLNAPALKNIAKSLHLSVPGSKKQVVLSIIDFYKHQRSVFTSSAGLKDTVMKRALTSLGHCYRIELAPKQTFNRVFLVFDVTKGTEDDSEFSLNSSNQNPYYNKNRQLFTILMAEMGQVTFPSYVVKKSLLVFENRTELLEYEAAYRLLTEIFAATESSQWEQALLLCKSAEEQSQTVQDSSKQRAMSLPRFLRGFFATAIYIRIKSLQVEVLQRLREYNAAAEVLRSLLKETHCCLSRRGFWAERLSLNLDQHLRDPAAALEVIKSALRGGFVRVGHLLALVERAQKILSSGKAKDEEVEDLLKEFEFRKAKEVTIVGRLLPKRMQTGQARFMKVGEGDDDVLLCSVEELVLDHYKSEGYDQGLHGEGGTFTCLFCLLMWDILFMPGIDDVFRTRYQNIPLDYNTDEFYLNRKNEIDRRLLQIRTWKDDDFDASQMILDHWEAYFGVACTGMNWERFKSPQQAVILAECIGGEILGGIMEVFAKDPRHTRSGLPDLVVWNITKRTYKLVEVKGPGDRLSNNQKMWMHRLVSLHADVEVCHVTASASRKLGA